MDVTHVIKVIIHLAKLVFNVTIIVILVQVKCVKNVLMDII